jgi:DNA-binding CsgD family transcriptional regulator
MSNVHGNTRSRKVKDPAQLSPRQKTIVELATRGKSADEIARVLGISRLTVRNQMAEVVEKLRSAGASVDSRLVARREPHNEATGDA